MILFFVVQITRQPKIVLKYSLYCTHSGCCWFWWIFFSRKTTRKKNFTMDVNWFFLVVAAKTITQQICCSPQILKFISSTSSWSRKWFFIFIFFFSLVVFVVNQKLFRVIKSIYYFATVLHNDKKNVRTDFNLWPLKIVQESLVAISSHFWSIVFFWKAWNQFGFISGNLI